MPRLTRRTCLPPPSDDPILVAFKQQLDNNRREKETANADFKAKIYSLINDHKSLRKRLTSRQTELISQAYSCCPKAEEFLGDKRTYEISEAQNFLWDAGDIVIMYQTNTENGKDSHDDESGSSSVEEVYPDLVPTKTNKKGAKGQEKKVLKEGAKVNGEEAEPQKDEAQVQEAESKPIPEPVAPNGRPIKARPAGIDKSNVRAPGRTPLPGERPKQTKASVSKPPTNSPRQVGSQKRKEKGITRSASPENTETPAKRHRKAEPRDETDSK